MSDATATTTTTATAPATETEADRRMRLVGLVERIAAISLEALARVEQEVLAPLGDADVEALSAFLRESWAASTRGLPEPEAYAAVHTEAFMRHSVRRMQQTGARSWCWHHDCDGATCPHDGTHD